MVIHDDFIIGHIPRTGGDVTKKIFVDHCKNSKVISYGNHAKHDPSWKIAKETNKTHILTFRKLDQWFLSYLMLGLQSGVYPHYDPWPLPTHEDIFNPKSRYGESNIGEELLNGPLLTVADRYFDLFTNNGQSMPEKYVRVEFLAEDVCSLCPEFDIVTIKSKIANPIKWNPRYNKRPSEHWSYDQIKILYEHNPKWAAVEKEIYDPKPKLF